MILGVDEVGRGPWAGPLVVGAVVLGSGTIQGLTDSKKLSKKRREELDSVIRDQASAIGLGWVHADEIDTVGLSESLRLATIRAVEQITVPYHEIIIDGTINFLQNTSKGQYVTTMKKADLLVPSVSAASIVAKVARDAYMSEQAIVYPGYGFKEHVGYGTAAHIRAIDSHGMTPLHRLSFKPLQKYANIKTTGLAPPCVTRLPSTKEIGDQGEEAAATYLRKQGHTILDRNWKTKFCEIDIVSKHQDVIFFTEVKYRKNTQQGGGLSAITLKKRRQMTFAAEYYALTHNIGHTDMRLCVVAVTGSDALIDELIEI